MPLRGERIRDMRERKGMTQRELAELTGVTLHQISRYENSRSDISANSLEALAIHLNVTMDYLVGRANDPNGYYKDEILPDDLQLIEAFQAGDSETIIKMLADRLRHLEALRAKRDGA